MKREQTERAVLNFGVLRGEGEDELTTQEFRRKFHDAIKISPRISRLYKECEILITITLQCIKKGWEGGRNSDMYTKL